MRFFKGVLCGIILSSAIHGWIIGWTEWKEKFQEKWNEVTEQEEVLRTAQLDMLLDEMMFPVEQENGRNRKQESEVQIKQTTRALKLGMNEQELKALLGEPTRIEPTPYGYAWWVFAGDWAEYIQVGIRDGVVSTYYTNSPAWGWETLYPEMIREEWSKKLTIQEEVSFRHQLGFYTFSLSAEEQKERPLWVDGDVAVQVYIDIHDGDNISAIRVMDLHTLLLQRPYALKYIGDLPEVPPLTEENGLEVARANEQQVFTLVNIVRRKQGLTALAWDEHVAYVARGHSADMLTNNYFDHFSPSSGDLGSRLSREQIDYLAAGENIAWNYIDAPDAHEGWLNSLGHRKNVFKKDFTHLGVGIVEKYYTQNFITN